MACFFSSHINKAPGTMKQTPLLLCENKSFADSLIDMESEIYDSNSDLLLLREPKECPAFTPAKVDQLLWIEDDFNKINYNFLDPTDCYSPNAANIRRKSISMSVLDRGPTEQHPCCFEEDEESVNIKTSKLLVCGNAVVDVHSTNKGCRHFPNLDQPSTVHCRHSNGKLCQFGCGMFNNETVARDMHTLSPDAAQRRHSDTLLNASLPCNVDACSHQGTCCSWHIPHHHHHHGKQQGPRQGVQHRSKIEKIGMDYMRMHGAFSLLGFKQLKKVESIVDQPSVKKYADENHELRPLTTTVSNDISTARGGPDSANSQQYQSSHVISRSFKMHTGCGSRNIGWRLRQRRQINHKLRRVSDYALAFAIFGMVVMIVETELTMAGIYDKASLYSYMMKAIISASSIILVGLILVYHSTMVQLYSVTNCIEDWRIAINTRGIAQMFLEVLICSVHPIPINFSFVWSIHITLEDRTSNKVVPFDLILSLPMFLRFYLIFRTLLLHSRMFTDASSRSIGALNRVKFNIRFVMKTLMTISPGTVLIVFIISMWITLSWIMRACESIHNPEQKNILNSMWVIAITFLSVGYGDLVPYTYCGRGIAVLTGVMGSSCTALVVAVFARKLELQRAEKHVHNFMMDNKSYKELRNSAANVLRETWLFYKYTKLVKQVNPGKIRSHQRKFLHAIKGLRKAKEDQRKIQEDSYTLVDLSKTQINISEMVTNIREDQGCISQRISSIEENIKLVQCQLDNIPRLIQSAVNPKLMSKMS